MLCRGQVVQHLWLVRKMDVHPISYELTAKHFVCTHCFFHRLNLAVSKSCTIPLVRDMMSHIKSISYFFNASEKRQCLLAKNIETHCSNSSRKKLLDVCRTRWVARILKLIHDFHFIVTLVVTRSVLDRTLPATQLLQTKTQI